MAFRHHFSVIFASFFVVACGGGSNNVTDSQNPLATADQILAEKAAITIVGDPAVKAAEAAVKAKWLSAAQATGGVSNEAMGYLDESVAEAAFQAALLVASGSSSNPKAISTIAAPHSWFGMNVPGSRVAFDNPDTIYYNLPVDAMSSYTISGKLQSPRPVNLNFSLYSNGTTLSNIAIEQLVTDIDGNFTITADALSSSEANHIQLAPGSTSIFVRETTNDWGSERLASLSINRNATVQATVKTTAQQVAAVVDFLQSLSTYFLTYNSLAYAQPANTLPAVTMGGTGGRLVTQAATYSAFQLSDDEALVVTVNLGGAKYFTAPAYNRWEITTDYIDHTQSLNNTQALPNPDGTITFVVSPSDPGVYNWVDTVGMHQGFINLRWQALPTTAAAVRPSATMKLVKVADLKTILPTTMKYVTAAERKAQLTARAASYARRYMQ